MTKSGNPVETTSITYTLWTLRCALRQLMQDTMRAKKKSAALSGVLPDHFELLADALEDQGLSRLEGAHDSPARARARRAGTSDP